MKNPVLLVKNLFVSFGNIEIISGVDMTIYPGEVHVVMGPNGSGKSTFVYTLMGHPSYTIKAPALPASLDSASLADSKRARRATGQNAKPKSHIRLNTEEISALSSEERAKKGLFLALQSPIAVPGVTVSELLRAAIAERSKTKATGKKPIHNTLLAGGQSLGSISVVEFMKQLKATAGALRISPDLLRRGIHDGFSGGERKKIELLEALILSPRVAMFDEVDTGLDVDALKIVAAGIEKLRQKGTAILLVTHYQRILRYVVPDVIHVLVKGKIVATGDKHMAEQIEKKGYGQYDTSATS